MIRMKGNPGARLLLLPLLWTGVATAADAPILPATVLDQFRPASAGEVQVVEWAEGILQGEVRVLAVLFEIRPEDKRDPQYARFLVVLPQAGFEQVASGLPSRVLRVGGAEQHFSSLAISDRHIKLVGKRYAPGDPRCCPSIPVKVSYRLDGSWLTMVASAQEDCQSGDALQRN